MGLVTAIEGLPVGKKDKLQEPLYKPADPDLASGIRNFANLRFHPLLHFSLHNPSPFGPFTVPASIDTVHAQLLIYMHVTATGSARHRFEYLSIYCDVFSKWSLLHGTGKIPRLRPMSLSHF